MTLLRGAARREPGGTLRVRQKATQGEAVQVDPIRSTLKAPGPKHLKLKCDILLSNFAFKFNLRRYTKAKQV
jgi:hypothetical protein